jgi:hypothetical protein
MTGFKNITLKPVHANTMSTMITWRTLLSFHRDCSFVIQVGVAKVLRF